VVKFTSKVNLQEIPTSRPECAVAFANRLWFVDKPRQEDATAVVSATVFMGTCVTDDEADLIERVRQGDSTAFADLMQRNRGPVWAVCLRITGNNHDAEDALQDTLVSAWRNIDRFRGEARFSTWLYRIASNAALAVVRRRLAVGDEQMEKASTAHDVGDRVADADRVQAALMSLPEAFRIALVLRIYGDFTYEDIAIHQDIPVQTVKSRISRARSMMEGLLTAAG
jgi:RNA polymerase sigma factor (sigma-70 family)